MRTPEAGPAASAADSAHAAASPSFAARLSHRARRIVVDIYLALRISTLGFTLMMPLLGLASNGTVWQPAQALWLLAMASCFHAFAYVLNDVIDLPIDRSEPLRADSPLVRGAWSRAQALVFALLQVPLAFGAAAMCGATGPSLAALAAAFGGMAIYNLRGKRGPQALLTDAVQSAAWCALLLGGAWAAAPAGAGAPAAATGWLAAYVFIAVMLVNGVHGSLRDLANDAACGATTTALQLGARPGPNAAVHVSAGLRAYAWALQAGLVACALAAWSSGPRDTGFLGTATALLALSAIAASLVWLARFFARSADRPAFVSAMAAHIVAVLLVLPALAWPALGFGGGLLLLAAAGLPVLAMRVYNGSHWRLAPPAAMGGTAGTEGAGLVQAAHARHARGLDAATHSWIALLRLTRPTRPLLAGGVVLLGAWLAGSRATASVWQLGAGVCCVVALTAAAFVVNDIFDAAADRLAQRSRPLASGDVSPRAAVQLALALAAAALLLAAALGPAALAYAAAVLVLSWAYSWRLKSTLLAGNLTIAVLVASLPPFGAAVAGRAGAASLVAAALVGLYVMAQEVLFTLEDLDTDRAAGVRTTAVRLGRRRCALLVQGLLCLFAAAALWPAALGSAGAVYAASITLTAVLPALWMARQLRGDAPQPAVAAAARLSRWPWIASLLPLALIAR